MRVAVRRVLALPAGRRHLIAVAGPPASGKSTFADRLAKQVAGAGRPACVVPMDGYHLDNRLLDADGTRARKGAPQSFDLRGFAALLRDLAVGGEVVHPIFDRKLDLAVAGAARVPADVDVVVVEGNYLLFDAPGWRDLAPLWSLSLRLDVTEEALRVRLVRRWLDHGCDPAEALLRAEANDLPNARAVLAHALRADLTVRNG